MNYFKLKYSSTVCFIYKDLIFCGNIDKNYVPIGPITIDKSDRISWCKTNKTMNPVANITWLEMKCGMIQFPNLWKNL